MINMNSLLLKALLIEGQQEVYSKVKTIIEGIDTNSTEITLDINENFQADGNISLINSNYDIVLLGPGLSLHQKRDIIMRIRTVDAAPGIIAITSDRDPASGPVDSELCNEYLPFNELNETNLLLAILKLNLAKSPPSQKAVPAPLTNIKNAENQGLPVISGLLGDILLTVDCQGKIVDINTAAEKLTGMSRADILNQNIQVVLPVTIDGVELRYSKFIEEIAGESKIVDIGRGRYCDAENATDIDLHIIGVPNLPGNTPPGGISVIARNISRRHLHDAELIREDQLESIGVLAGGLAHDLNNLLTGVLGNISLAKLSALGDPELTEILERSQKALGRARGISEKMLTLSKGSDPVCQTSSIVEIIRESGLFALSGSSTNCLFDFEENLKNVDFDRTQVGQVFQNLVTNADQAMPMGGSITIQGRNEYLSEETGLALKPGEYVKISVYDTGPGIAPELIDKIFDPFFTTKKNGSGLGLAACCAIMARHKGLITVEAGIERGSVFHCYFPASNDMAEFEPVQRRNIKTGEGKILIVDDEIMVAETAGILLNKLGYQCSEAHTSEQALKLFREACDLNDRFDLVILDLTLPGDIGGEEILVKLRNIDPAVKAIVSSGYSNNQVMSRYKDFGFDAIAAKPYSLEEVSQIIFDLLMQEEIPVS